VDCIQTEHMSVDDHAARIASVLQQYDRIVVLGHGSPDADAIGASAAMAYLLRALGKRVCLYNGSGMPAYLSWLELPVKMVTSVRNLPFKPNLAVVLDCGDAWRVGKDFVDVLPTIPSINIDHHMSNPHFGSVDNWVEPSMAATGQMIALIAKQAGVPLDGALAEYIYLALIGDTGSFSHGNTSAEVLELAAELLRNGLDAAALRNKMDNQWSLAKMHLWGAYMSKISLESEGRIAVSKITLAELAEFGTTKEDLEGFVELMRHLKGVRVACMIRGNTPKRCKISLRSAGKDDVQAVAALFGGGGHKNASGALVDMSMDVAEAKFIEAITAML